MKKILIPTDFSEAARLALAPALRLAEPFGAKISVLNVTDIPADMLYDYSGGILDEDTGEGVAGKKMAENKLKMTNFLADFPQIEALHSFGKITDTICETAEKNGFDLVIMGTKGADGLQELISGSMTAAVMRHCRVPLLSFRCDRADIELSNLLIINDFSSPKKENISVIPAMSEVFGAKIHLLCVASVKTDEAKITENMDVFARLNGLKNYEKHFYADTDTKSGITDFTDTHSIDLMVIGTHGRTGLMRWLKGSISESLINRFYRPIITFRLSEAN